MFCNEFPQTENNDFLLKLETFTTRTIVESFIHPHDVLIDDNENMPIQCKSEKVYIKIRKILIIYKTYEAFKKR